MSNYLFEAVFQICDLQNGFLLMLCIYIITQILPKSSTGMCKKKSYDCFGFGRNLDQNSQ